MSARARAIGAVAALGYAVLVLRAAWHDRKDDLHGPTASFCYRGVMPSVCLGCTLHTNVLHLRWGPPEFRMTADGASVPGITVGVLTNSAGICTEDEAAAYGARQATKD